MKPVPHFLVVDDDDIDIMTIKRAFRAAKMEVIIDVARNGQEALDFLRSPELTLPVTILLDINMPRMNGFEALDAIRKDPSLHKHQVFMLSTSAADKDRVAAYDRQVAGYIVKPVAFDEVCEAMRVLTGLWEINSFPPAGAA